MKKSDVFTGLILVLFCGWGWYDTSKWKEVQTVGMSVKDYPRMIFTLIGICGLIMLIRGLRSKEQSNVKFRWKTLLPVALLLITYAVVLEYIGFIISTLIFLGISMYLFGEKNWRKIITIDVIGTGVLYVIFVKLLMVQL